MDNTQDALRVALELVIDCGSNLHAEGGINGWYAFEAAMENAQKTLSAAPASEQQPSIWAACEELPLSSQTEQQPMTDEQISEIYRESFNSWPDRARNAPANVPPLVINFARALLAQQAAGSQPKEKCFAAWQAALSQQAAAEPVYFANKIGNEWHEISKREFDEYLASNERSPGLYRLRKLYPAPPAQAPVQQPVAKVRVTNKSYVMELSAYASYALPEGLHDLYAAPVQPVQQAAQTEREAEIRARALEEAAKACDEYETWLKSAGYSDCAYIAQDCTKHIRALSNQPAQADGQKGSE